MAALRLSVDTERAHKAAAVPPTAFCRVCFEGPGASPLVSPCQCAGSGQHIHRSCLRRWQRAALSSGNNIARARVCGVCNTPYAPCFRIAKAGAEGQGQGNGDDVGLRDEGNASVMAGLRQAAGALGGLSSPSSVLKSITIFGLALLVPYLVLAYYACLALSYIDPFDGGGRFGSVAAEAEQREAAAAAVEPGRTFLVASSRISPGSFFHRSVVFVLEHSTWGSRGVIVNKPHHRHRHHPSGLRALSACALLGGPVDPLCLTVIHNDAAAAAAAARGTGIRPWEVAPGLFVETSETGGRGGGTAEVVPAPSSGSGGSSGLLGLLQRWRRDGAGAPSTMPPFSSASSSSSSSSAAAAPTHSATVSGARAFVGYAGWSTQQLQEEIRRGDWHVFDADADAAHLLFELAVETDGSSPSGIPSSAGQGQADEDGDEDGDGGLMDAGALLWRELVSSVGDGGEDEDDDEEEE